jgi:uncharacterized OsmC-like protein
MAAETTPTPLHVERVGVKTYIGRNGRGGEVRIGSSDAEGVLSPAELLQVALAACGILSSDHTLASRLGDDFAARVNITATKPDGEDRYSSIAIEILANMEDLEPDKHGALIDRAQRAIDRLCTVGHTLDQRTAHPVSIRNESSLPGQI